MCPFRSFPVYWFFFTLGNSNHVRKFRTLVTNQTVISPKIQLILKYLRILCVFQSVMLSLLINHPIFAHTATHTETDSIFQIINQWSGVVYLTWNDYKFFIKRNTVEEDNNSLTISWALGQTDYHSNFFFRLSGLHSALDLMLFLDPNDEDSRLLLARIQVHLGIDLEEVCFISQFPWFYKHF